MTIKMITGEEIVADVDTDSEDYLIVDNPMHVDYFYDTAGIGIKLVPYISTSKYKLFTLSKKHIIFYSQTEEVISEYYQRCCSEDPHNEEFSLLNENDYTNSSKSDKKKLH